MIQPSISSNFSGPTTQAFTIEANESMFALLTSRVYTDTVLAPIREWSTNAIDACIAAGATPRFDVHLPTFEDPTFSVRDFGTGLSPEDILGLFCTFGASTKRDSNDFNGTFGIGRVSGLAYTTSFTVESFFENTHHSYLITVSNGLPSAIHLSSAPTTEPSGLRLSLAVKTEDIPKFQSKAQSLFTYFDTKPSLNIELDIQTPQYSVTGSHWAIDPSRSGNYIRMSNVCYKIPSDGIDTQGLSSLLIDLPNGAINYNPGRESLSLDSHTVAYLNAMFGDIHEEYLASIHSSIANAVTPAEKLTAFYIALSTAPRPVRSSITPPTLNFVSSFAVSSWYGSPRTVNLNLTYTTVRSKQHYYARLRNDHPQLSDFLSAPYVIVDTKTNYMQAIKSIGDTLSKEFYVLSALSNTTFDEFLAEAEAFLAYFNITNVHYTSHHTTAKASTAEARKTETPYVSTYRADRFLKAEISDPSETYYYIPLSGARPIIEEARVTALHRGLQLFNLELHGVPKKYLAAAEASPNFVPAEAHLIKALESATFTAYEGISELRPFVKDYQSPPPVIATAVAEYQAYKADTNHHYPHILRSIAAHFPIQFTLITPTYSYETLKTRYPLFITLNNCYSSKPEHYQHYLDLEELKHAQVSPPH